MLYRYCIKWQTITSIPFSRLLLSLIPKRQASSSLTQYHQPRLALSTEQDSEGDMGKKRPRRVDSDEKHIPSPSYQRYTYQPLQDAHIRLLRLHSDRDSGSPLRFSIFHTPLVSAPTYTALSYTWGERAGSGLVLIDADHVSVTPNLKHALQRLRRTDQEVLLWVDALCINQDDVVERGIQTTRMRGVYQHADSVAVWLGMEYGFSQGAVALVRELSKASSAGIEMIRSMVLDPENKEKLDALVALFRRQYWWRIWVIQEVSCARRAIVYVGGEEIPWVQLDGVCEVLRGVEAELHSIFYKFPSYVRTLTHGGPRGLQLSRYNPTIAAPPLLELLLTHKSKKSTDPKDKVFALVGISASRHLFGDIDYARSMRDIYTYTARHIISITKKLDVICVKQHDMAQFNLPSWTPDWTRPMPGAGATILGLHHRLPPFSAAGDTDAVVEFHDQGEEGDYVLRTKGVVIDTIGAVGRLYKKRGAPSNIGPGLQAFHDWWSLFLSSHPNPETVSGEQQARFGRLISCGTWEFDGDEKYIEKLAAIFALSEEDILHLDPLSRASTMESAAMTSSVSSLRGDGQLEEDEELEGGGADEAQKERVSAILSATLMMNRRRLFVSRNGILGLAPWNADVGDEVVVLFGCKFPVVIREGAGGRSMLVGEAYVEGFMEGEAIKGLEEGRLKVKDFELT